MTGPRRVTEKQLAANRRNAGRSTGPRTPAGKSVSRWNALTHGALAQAVIPPALELYESRPDFESLLATLRGELVPGSALEEMLVERIATSYWRLARVLRAEAAAIAGRQESLADDQAQNADFDAMFGTRRAPTLADGVAALSVALSNKRRLRSLMAGEDPRWRDADDEELLTAAQARLAEMQAQLDRQRADKEALQRAQRSIPYLEEALMFARYETTLERQLYRALDALERLQRLRAGEALPPPLRLSVDLAAGPDTAGDT